MSNMKIYGDIFKKLLFSNKGITAVDYSGLKIYIPVELLAKMIHYTWFDVDEKGEAVYFTFDPRATH